MVRFLQLWPVACVLALGVGTIRLDIVAFPASFLLGLVLDSMIGGLTAAVFAVMTGLDSSPRRGLLLRIGCVILSTVTVGVLLWLPFLLFWRSTLSVIAVVIGVVVGVLLFLAPLFAGLRTVLPHIAAARSVVSIGYGLTLYILLGLASTITRYEDSFLTQYISPAFARLVYAAAVGSIWTGAVLFLNSRSDADLTETQHEHRRSPLMVICAAQSVWAGYLLFVLGFELFKLLPSKVWSWDSLFWKWGLLDRVLFAGTTASLVFTVCLIAFLVIVWRVPLWMHLTAVISLRMTDILGFVGWRVVAQHPLVLLAGLVFFVVITAGLHWLVDWIIAQRVVRGGA